MRRRMCRLVAVVAFLALASVAGVVQASAAGGFTLTIPMAPVAATVVCDRADATDGAEVVPCR